MTYIVKQGESIKDVALNATGSISSWNSILQLNEYTSWNPILTAGDEVIVPEVVDSIVYSALSIYPSCNAGWTSINDSELAILKTLLNQGTPPSVELPPDTVPLKNYYTVKQGETIRDIALNTTGSIDNWKYILIENGYTSWNPTLVAGQQLLIPSDVEIQKNVLRELNIYPACNAPNISDLDAKIQNIISIFVTAKQFENYELFQFEDTETYQFES